MANNERDFIYTIQGSKSFLKVKMDWANIDKLHFSFVSHTGRGDGCKQLGHIEAAMRIDGADGAYFFASAALNNRFDKMRQTSLKEAAASGSKFPRPIYTYNGGSQAKNDKPVMWRELSLSPGSKAEYVFTVREAEGVQNQLGGYSKKEGAKVSTIFVSLTSAELTAMARAILMHWQAFLINPMAYPEAFRNAVGPELGANPVFPNADAYPPMDGQPQTLAKAAVPAQPAAPAVSTAPTAQIPNIAYSVYDSIGYGMEIALTPEKALESLQQFIKSLKSKGGWARRDNVDYEKTKNVILSGATEDIPPVRLFKGNESCMVNIIACSVRK